MRKCGAPSTPSPAARSSAYGTDLDRERDDQSVRTRKLLFEATPHTDAYAVSPAGVVGGPQRCAEEARLPFFLSKESNRHAPHPTMTQEHHQPQRGDSLTPVG